MSAFERSLRGAPSPSPASTGSSSLKPAEARKKKSVRWNVSEADIPHDLCDNASGGVLRASNGPNGGLGSIPEQSIDHLRVPSTRPASNASRIEVTRNFDNHGPTGATAATASSSRKRTGERGIQAGAVRVRTPAKPKRPRAADGTPAGVLATMSSSGNHDNAARGGRPTPHSYLRRSGLATSATSSPKQSPARRSRSAQDAPTPAPPAARVSSRSPTIRSPPRPRFATAANAASSSTPAPACTPAAAAARAKAKASPRRRISASQALRNVAGGDAEDAGAFGDDNDFDEAGMEGEEGEEPVVNGVSPMSLLSNTLSSIDIIGSAGRPPRSPTKACRSPRAGWSPRAGAGVGVGAAAARSSPGGGGESPRARGLSIAAGQRRTERAGPAATSNGLGRGFFSSGSSLPQEPEEEEGEGGEAEEDAVDELAPSVMRQSLESRLAAASSSLAASSRKASPDAVRSTTNTTTTTSPRGSPFRTVVRRRSTSLVHVNGESSFVSEEVSEESSFSVNSSCSCQHDPGLGGTTGAMVEHEQQQLVVHEDGGERENGSSIEVRNRLDELQERNSALEQEKVNLTMALVPLEERLQSKEKAWESERRELVIRTEESLRAAKTAEERAREVEKRKVEMEEERHTLDAEVRRLRGEIEQRESKTAESFWQRTVAADREKTRLETALDQAQARVVTLSNEKSELEAELLPIQSEAASFRVRFTEAEKVASRVLRAEEALRFSEVQLEVMKTEFGATSAQLMAMQTELAQQKAGARKQLEEKERKAGDAVASMRREMERLKEAICIQADRVVEAASKSKQASAEGGDRQLVLASPDPSAALMSSEATRIRQQELTNLRTELDIERERGLHRQRLLEEGEDERRRMHNIIQELRGSVRVFVRARPFLKADGEDAAEQGAGVVSCGSDSCSVAVVPPDNPNRAISCAFDHVFGGHASQEDVFKEVSGFVQSALDGFKVCLFSYGQTGSGKTHTMAGSGTGMMRGIVPRAVEHILARVGELQDGPWSYSVQASFLEIYNEELRDLLVGHGDSDSGASANTRSANGAGASAQKLSIKLAAGGGTEVVGLTKFPIDTSDRQQGLGELDEIMSVAQRSRSVASTAMNAQSSRSHSVFTLWLTGFDASTGTTLKGVLHLVDLAGSERLDRSGVGSDAQRLKETQNINKSLSCLADVFSALSAKASHIPFRNSKLTYLMQDCLSGEGKALMFVNVSPTAPSASETVCSLRFANQVSQVQLGKATRQMSLSKPTGSRGGGRPPSSGNSPTRSQVNRPTRASGSGASSASTAPPSPRTSAGSTTRAGSSFGFGRASVGGRRTSISANGPASPSRTRRAVVAAGGGGGSVAGRTRLSSSSVTGPPSPRTLGRGGGRIGASGRPSMSGAGSAAQSRGSVSGVGTASSRGSVRGAGGGASGKFGGRASVGGAGRKSMSTTRGVRGSEGARAKSVSGAAAVAEAAAVVAAEAAAARKAKKAPEERTSFSGSTRPSSAISRINEGMPPSPNPHAAVDKRPRLSVDEEGMMSM